MLDSPMPVLLLIAQRRHRLCCCSTRGAHFREAACLSGIVAIDCSRRFLF